MDVETDGMDDDDEEETAHDVLMTTRKLACLTGIPNGERKDAWQTLLGIQQDQISLVEFAKNERECDRDETQARTISTDCERSYFNLDKEKETQKEKRRELERCLRSVFGGRRENGLNYYQGFHAIAQVVLSIGEGKDDGAEGEGRDKEEDANARYKISCAMLERLASFSLRDNTRETMYPAILTLRICLARLIDAALSEDDELKEAITFGARKNEYQFALQKLLTWHSMSGDSSKRKSCSANTSEEEEKEEEESKLECVKRVFDLFLASHPLMPIYLTVAVLLRERDGIIKARHEFNDEDVLFSFLSRLETVPDLKSYDTDTRNEITAEEVFVGESEHEKKKKIKRMMQKVRTVSFGSSSSLAISMSPSKRKKNKWLKARQLRAVDALCHSALKMFSQYPPTKILRANEIKTTFNGSSFDRKRYPPLYLFSEKLASPTPVNDHDEPDIHVGEQIEIRKAVRSKRMRFARRKAYLMRRRVDALPFLLKMVACLFAYVQWWENVAHIHPRLAYGPDIRISTPSYYQSPHRRFFLLLRAIFVRLFFGVYS